MKTDNSVDAFYLAIIVIGAIFLVGALLIHSQGRRGVSRKSPVDASLELYVTMRDRKYEAMRLMRQVARQRRRPGPQ
ncbi:MULTISPECIES: hypothetical protein [unclassified Streptomyces]|uniref:Uncharacterized protein n=1 Tax=Streptomyces sp. NBC_00060 TaxID=2975636 RepID=A0AAU2GUW6_9ACTN